MENRMLNTNELKEYLGVSYASTLKFIKYSGIRYTKVGRMYRVSAAELERFIGKEDEQQSVSPKQVKPIVNTLQKKRGTTRW